MARIPPRRRVRCVFSESSDDQTLGIRAGSSPGGPPGGVVEGRAMTHWMRMPARVVRAVLGDAVTTMFPGDCRICGGPLLRLDAVPVCGECVARTQAEVRPLCRRCGEWMGMESARAGAQFGIEGLECTPCRMAPPEFERAVAYGVYEDGMREMLHLLKYDGLRQMAGVLGKMLAEAVVSLRGEMPAGEVLVVAVPLFGSKRRQRGYNQAELLASAAMAELRRRVPEWRMVAGHGAMLRARDTESQFGLTPRARRANLRGAFEVIDPAAVAGREVLLVDDIYTTGATARACAKVLRAGGAGRVWVATLARAQAETVAMWDMAGGTATWDGGASDGGACLGAGLEAGLELRAALKGREARRMFSGPG